jgi:hypothetical protein
MAEPTLSGGDWFFGKLCRMGANWKTTLGGVLSEVFLILTVLSVAPYTMPPEITSIIAPKLKAIFLSVCLSAKVIVSIWTWWNTKSKDVTGGNTQQTLNGEIAKPGEQTLVDLTKAAPPAT